MIVRREVLERSTTADTDVVDLSEDVARIVARSGIRDGTVLVFVPGSTGVITTIEYESGAVADLKAAIERIAPMEIHYDHDARWGDGNGYAHVRAALLGPSESFPVVDGRPLTGTWQQIVLCDFDNKPRTRKIVVQVSGSDGGAGFAVD